MSKRQILLDTETTGLDPAQGHHVIEIACIELVERRFTGDYYHTYINPQRTIDAGAQAVHGITTEFLAEKPIFAAIVDEFLAYIEGAEIIAHNAPFDIGFLNHELSLLKRSSKKNIRDYASVFDTLTLARKMHPGQRNNLDALCKRYKIDNTKRNLHGALLDARLLGEVYLCMTGGQKSLFGNELEQEVFCRGKGALNSNNESDDNGKSMLGKAMEKAEQHKEGRLKKLKIIMANAAEQAKHQAHLEKMRKTAGKCAWLDEEEN